MSSVDLINCAASISFDMEAMTLTISHADSSGVSGELSLYLDEEDLTNLIDMLVRADAALDDSDEEIEDEDEDAT